MFTEHKPRHYYLDGKSVQFAHKNSHYQTVWYTALMKKKIIRPKGKCFEIRNCVVGIFVEPNLGKLYPRPDEWKLIYIYNG